jgi:DNA repair exonuclease SbcCD nuclease subunit
MPAVPLGKHQGWDRQWRLVLAYFCVMMMMFMGRVVQVRSWIPSQLHHRQRGVGRLPELPITSSVVVPCPYNTRNFQSSSRLFVKFDVGDSVTVKVDNSRVNGTVQEARGGGWYSVQPINNDATTSDASSSTIKCRSTQMGRLVDDSKSGGTNDDPRNKNDALTTVQMFSAPNPTRPIVHPDAGENPEFPPPAPTIYDLDAALLDRSNVAKQRDQEFLEQVKHHSDYEKWVVFTDLHCSPASLDTCLEVLKRVHELAVERDAGVLFLGDFWHHRGTLRVDCLNSVLDHFRDWTVPMIMIPGNHDQVTLDGHSHGLTPFENAYRVGNVSGPLVLSYPTKFNNALFIPHIRDIATMESILQSSSAMEASALFVHAEVTGALMNDLIVSMNGIPPASFPHHKRIYSGHFHKPHTVQTSNGAVQIEYLGSPYETTLAEAQQAKSLAILDSNWTCIEYVPIDIGRRHFKVSSWDELFGLQLKDSSALTRSLDNSTVRSGDRIVASIKQADMGYSQTPEMNAKIKELRAAGVMVEIREIKSVVEQALGSSLVGGEAEKLEEMSPESTWRAYIDEEEHQRKNLDNESAKVILEAGLEVLQELEASEEVRGEQSKEVTDLALTKVSVEGFGPFRDKVTYPLSQRGLVLLKGTNNDSGSDR